MFTSRYLAAGVLAVLACLTTDPRAEAGEKTSTVMGNITVDGQPLSAGKIIFYGGEDQFVGAKIKKDGTFKLDRVPVGTYIVAIESKGLPARYASEDKSPLRVEVKEGANQLDFDLRSK
jgi:hypothetical protein